MFDYRDHLIDKKVFNRILTAYLLIQAAIWVKVAAYYSMIGNGATAGYGAFFGYAFNPSVYPEFFANLSQPLFAFDVVFHQTVHVLITLCLFAFVKNAKRLELADTVPLFFIASLLHNISYWATGIFHSPYAALDDFWNDFALLYVIGWMMQKALEYYPALRSFKIPLLETK